MSATDSRSLLGRESELEVIRGALEAGPVSGATFALVGEPGIGKTALLAAAGSEALQRGHLVLSITAVEAEAHFPYAGLHQLIEPVLHVLPQVAEGDREGLEVALGLSDGSAPDLFLVATGLVAVLRAVAADRPLTVLVDDVQWLDQATHDCIAYLARKAATVPLALLATVRVEREGARPPFLSVVSEEVSLRGLDDETARSILSRSAAGLSGQQRFQIQLEAGGNPLALIELPATWRDSDGERIHTLSKRLERDFGGRVADLPPPARDLLLVAAVDESRDLDEVLEAASVLLGAPLTVDEIETAFESGLLKRSSSLVEFRHPLVRSGILQVERVSRRQAAHSAVAAVIKQDDYRRAWHRAQAIIGPDDEIAAELEATVEISLGKGAVMAAIGSLERAAELSSTPSQRGRRLLKAAEHAFGLGRADLVDKLVGRAAGADLDDLDWARMQWLREIFNDGIPGDATRVLELCEFAERSAQAEDTDLALNLLLGAALRCWWADTGPAARARVVDVVERLDAGDDPRAVAALGVAEPVLRASVVTDALRRLPADEVDDVDALRLLGMAAHAIGDSPRSDDYLCAAELGLRRQQRLGVLVHALSMHVIVSLELGDWERAAEASLEVIRLAEETGQPIWTTGSLVCEALAQALRGQPERALELVAQVEINAYRERLNDLLSCAQLARGIADLDMNRPSEACDDLLRMFDPSDPTYHQRECFGGLMFLAEAAVLCDRAETVRPVMDRLEDLAFVTPTPILRVHLAYARAVLASDEDAEALFTDALSSDLSRWPWVKARLELAYGTFLRNKRPERDASPLLSSALEVLDALGARHWADEARSRLRSAVESTPAR